MPTEIGSWRRVGEAEVKVEIVEAEVAAAVEAYVKSFFKISQPSPGRWGTRNTFFE